MAEDLKACPFCGGRDLWMREALRCWVRCCGCGAEGGYGDDEAEAAAAWNRRAADVRIAELEARVERLRNLANAGNPYQREHYWLEAHRHGDLADGDDLLDVPPLGSVILADEEQLEVGKAEELARVERGDA